METLEFLRQEGGTVYWRFADDGSKITKPLRATRREVHSLVISDTHLGAGTCRARALLTTLNTFYVTDHLVLNGDIFQDLDFERLPGAHWNVLSRIRKLTDPDMGLNEVWIRGNHDEKIREVMRHLVGIPVTDEYQWECGGKKYLAIHGDRWDRFVSDRPGLTRMVIWLHDLVQKVDPQNRHVVRFLSRKLGQYRGESDLVAAGAADYGREKAADYVLCGYTHLAMRRQFPEIEYLNSGCWTQNPCSFITVTEDGPLLNFVELS